MRLSSALFRPLYRPSVTRAAGNTELTPDQVRENTRRLVVEITWYGILVGCTINLLQVYVVRLGASSLLVGAVTYGPALVGVFWQIPAAQWMRRNGHRMRFVLGAGLLHRLGYLLVALLPFVIQDRLAEATVVVLVIQAFASALSSTAFLTMMSEAVPPAEAAQLVSWRMAGFGLTSTLSTLLAGLVLARVPFPLNYQVLFLVGFTTSLLSQWNVGHIWVPDRAPSPGVRVPMRQRAGGFLRQPRFLRFLGIVAVLQLGLGMVVPLMPLFAVRALDATDAQISLVVTVVSASSVLGSLLMRRVLRRLGRESMLAAGILGYGFYPLLLSLAPSVGWLIPCAAIGGFFSAAISVTLFDNLVAVSPDGDKTGHVAIYNVFVNSALFAGPLLAGLMARGTAGPAIALRVAAAACLLATLLAARWQRAG